MIKWYFGVRVKFLPPTNNKGKRLRIKAMGDYYSGKTYPYNYEMGWGENAVNSAMKYLEEVVRPKRAEFISDETPIIIGAIDTHKDEVILVIEFKEKEV